MDNAGCEVEMTQKSTLMHFLSIVHIHDLTQQPTHSTRLTAAASPPLAVDEDPDADSLRLPCRSQRRRVLHLNPPPSCKRLNLCGGTAAARRWQRQWMG